MSTEAKAKVEGEAKVGPFRHPAGASRTHARHVHAAGRRKNPFSFGSAMKRDREAMRQYERAMSVLQSESAPDSLRQLEQEFDGFPEGVDPNIGRRWIINAIDFGSLAPIRWILARGIELNFRDEEGYTPLHSAIDRGRDDKIEVLRLLLKAGASVNPKEINDWTPAHMAAARDDVESLRVLVQHGADLTIRTEIDDYATPLEEARNLGRLNAVRFLEALPKSAESVR